MDFSFHCFLENAPVFLSARMKQTGVPALQHILFVSAHTAAGQFT